MRLRTPGERVPAGLKDAHAPRHAFCENDSRPGRQLSLSYRKGELRATERIHQERLHVAVAKCERSQVGNCIANRGRDNREQHTFSLRLSAQFRMFQDSGYCARGMGGDSIGRVRLTKPRKAVQLLAKTRVGQDGVGLVSRTLSILPVDAAVPRSGGIVLLSKQRQPRRHVCAQGKPSVKVQRARGSGNEQSRALHGRLHQGLKVLEPVLASCDGHSSQPEL